MDGIRPLFLYDFAVLDISELHVEFVPKWMVVAHGGNCQFFALIEDGLDRRHHAGRPATEHLQYTPLLQRARHVTHVEGARAHLESNS